MGSSVGNSTTFPALWRQDEERGGVQFEEDSRRVQAERSIIDTTCQQALPPPSLPTDPHERTRFGSEGPGMRRRGAVDPKAESRAPAPIPSSYVPRAAVEGDGGGGGGIHRRRHRGRTPHSPVGMACVKGEAMRKGYGVDVGDQRWWEGHNVCQQRCDGEVHWQGGGPGGSTCRYLRRCQTAGT